MDKFCTKCGAKLLVNSNFCSGCGSALKKIASQNPAEGAGKSKSSWTLIILIVLIGAFAGPIAKRLDLSAVGIFLGMMPLLIAIFLWQRFVKKRSWGAIFWGDKE